MMACVQYIYFFCEFYRFRTKFIVPAHCATQCWALDALPKAALGPVLKYCGMGLLNSKNVLSVSVRTAFQDAILFFFPKGPTQRDDAVVMGMCDFAVHPCYRLKLMRNKFLF